ncbi:hypothetical protein KCP74_00975 [Salmonella enterica subsp. enterica]|nr:hypothetical protein KCP74_00975 [Salmonella enterica subsp. enterica]
MNGIIENVLLALGGVTPICTAIIAGVMSAVLRQHMVTLSPLKTPAPERQVILINPIDQEVRGKMDFNLK